MLKLNPLQAEAIARYLKLPVGLCLKAAFDTVWFSRKFATFNLSNAQLTEVHKILEANKV